MQSSNHELQMLGLICAHCLSVIYLSLVTHAATAGNEVKIIMSRYACEVALKRERSQLSREEGVSY
jgi:hypothetical protein